MALDYGTAREASEKGRAVLGLLKDRFGDRFVEERMGVKINQDLLTGNIDGRLVGLSPNTFADMKISHGSDTGQRIMVALKKDLGDVRYVTVSASLGSKILREYVSEAERLGMEIIAFTAHTKIPEQDVKRMYNRASLDDIIFNLSETACEAGCHAVVLEAGRLNDKRISSLPIKKLVTGIRINPVDKGTQSRVTTLEELRTLRHAVDYAVVSSRYLEKPELVVHFVSGVLRG